MQWRQTLNSVEITHLENGQWMCSIFFFLKIDTTAVTRDFRAKFRVLQFSANLVVPFWRCGRISHAVYVSQLCQCNSFCSLLNVEGDDSPWGIVFSWFTSNMKPTWYRIIVFPCFQHTNHKNRHVPSWRTAHDLHVWQHSELVWWSIWIVHIRSRDIDTHWR